MWQLESFQHIHVATPQRVRDTKGICKVSRNCPATCSCSRTCSGTSSETCSRACSINLNRTCSGTCSDVLRSLRALGCWCKNMNDRPAHNGVAGSHFSLVPSLRLPSRCSFHGGLEQPEIKDPPCRCDNSSNKKARLITIDRL